MVPKGQGIAPKWPGIRAQMGPFRRSEGGGDPKLAFWPGVNSSGKGTCIHTRARVASRGRGYGHPIWDPIRDPFWDTLCRGDWG